MAPRVLNEAQGFFEGLVDGALAELDKGIVPFLTSPYGIVLMLVVLFLFLNSMRMKL